MLRHFLLFLFFLISSHSFLQESNDTISLKFENASLLSAIKQLKKNSSYRYAYSSRDLRSYKVNGEFRSQNILTILEVILPPELSFSLAKGLILIYHVEGVSESDQDPNLFNIGIIGECKDYYTKEVLPYATIKVLSSGIIIQSNQDGEFQLEAFFSDTSSLIVSYLGYKEKVVRPIDFENPNF